MSHTTNTATSRGTSTAPSTRYYPSVLLISVAAPRAQSAAASTALNRHTLTSSASRRVAIA
jgi:hypothetical protein